MPVYEYACTACGHLFEHLSRSMSDPPPQKCPECQSRKVEKRLSVFASGGAAKSNFEEARGCGRCGDPNGPCS